MNVHATQISMALLALIASLAVGCKSESTPRSTLELTMEANTTGEKLIVPGDTPLEISKYLVNGKGPDDDTFSVVSAKNTISVGGLLIGSWEVSVDGLSATGSRLASGSATIQLRNDPTPQTIYLDTLEGTGAARILIQWDSTLIADPSLTLELSGQGDQTAQRQSLDTSTLASGYVSWNTTSLEAGSYMLIGKLYAGDVQVSGFAEAIRIVDGLSADATITLDLGKTTSIPSTINLVDTVGQPVVCSIAGLSEQMDASSEVTANIEPEPGSEVDLVWYQDGNQVASGLTYTFTPSLGNHRLDVVASGTGKASLGSASFTYEGTLSGTPGVPVSLGKVSDANGQLNAKKGSQLAFLGDGNVLVAGSEAIQICKLVRDRLVVLQNYSASNAPTWPVANISDVAVDQGRNLVFIADNGGKCLWEFSYDSDEAKLSYLRKSDNQTFAASSGDYAIKETGRLKLDTHKALAYMSLIDDANRVYALAYREEPASGESFRLKYPLFFATATVTAGDGETFTPLFHRTAISDDGTYLVALDEHNLIVFTNTINRERQGLNPLPVKLLCATAAYRDVKVRDIAIVGANNVIASSDDGVYFLGGNLASQSSESLSNWKIRQATKEGAITLTDGKNATFQDMGELFMCEEKGICYGLCSASANIIAMAKGDDGSLLFKGACDLDGFPPSELALSPDGKTMLVASESEDGVMLLRMP